MLTLLDIGQAAAIKARIRVPETLIGNSDKNARVILLAAQEAATELSREYNWTQLINYEADSANYGVSHIDLPGDFDRIVDDTVWSISNQANFTGPIGFDDWQFIEAGGQTPQNNCFSIHRPAIVDRNTFNRLNVFSISDDNRISYYWVSKYHAYNGQQIDVSYRQEFFERDTDKTVLDYAAVKQLTVVKTLQTLGMSYASEFDEYNDMMTERTGRDRGSVRVNMNQRRSRAGRGDGWRGNCSGDPIFVNLPIGGWR